MHAITQAGALVCALTRARSPIHPAGCRQRAAKWLSYAITRLGHGCETLRAPDFMSECRICRHTFKALKFKTEHIDICTRCVNTLNATPEPAIKAQERLAEMLARGMLRNAERDLESGEEWKCRKARWTLDNFDAAVAKALPDWITKLLANRENSTRDFKIMRAHRRGLLRMDGFADYPGNWTEVARGIRARDRMRCTSCGTMDAILDVHHIVYLSKYGTNQQHNLITLCRPCHQTEHGREFDGPEAKDPESISPIQPPPGAPSPAPQPPVSTPAPEIRPPIVPSLPATPRSVNSNIDLRCPRCVTVLTIPKQQAVIGQKLRCRQCGVIFLYGITRVEPSHDQSSAPLRPAPLDSPAQTQLPTKPRATPAHWEAARAQLRQMQSTIQQSPPSVVAASHSPIPEQPPSSPADKAQTPSELERPDILDSGLVLGAVLIAVIIFLIVAAIHQ